jgi:hypothetical protein
MLAAGLQWVRRWLLVAVRMGERAGPEGEVVQVLVQRMAGRAAPQVGRLVDEHGVHGLDVVANETRNAIEDGRQLAVAGIERRVSVVGRDALRCREGVFLRKQNGFIHEILKLHYGTFERKCVKREQNSLCGVGRRQHLPRL